MKKLLLLFVLVSCADLPEHYSSRPPWVESIRSGEGSLKVANGQKTYYRRIAGSRQVSQQVACNLVIQKAEEDIKKEYPHLSQISYVTEVLYYDREYGDCAVTLSVNNNIAESSVSPEQQYKKLNRKIALDSQEFVSEDEAAEFIKLRSDIAMKFALSGLTKPEFEKFSREKVVVFDETNLCTKFFNTTQFSIHGATHVCWKKDIIVGYCTTADKQCWTRTP